jgi:hypothetical protein
MSEATITCPKCKTEIPLTETLTAPLLEAERKKFRDHLDREVGKLRQREAELEKATQNLDTQVEQRVEAVRSKIAEEEAQKARQVLQSDLTARTAEIQTLKETLQNRDEKLAEAQKAQAEIVRKERELEDAKREIDLTIEKRVSASAAEIRSRVKQEADESWQLKNRESEQRISQLQTTIDTLKRQVEQGSQQLQGEVFELELEETLRRQFPIDTIEPVAKGHSGADVVQRVCTPSGPVGAILWEVKRTQNWTDGWLAKLRADLRAAGADVAMIVSHVLPKDIHSFDFRDGVWITSPRCAIPLAVALRELLIAVSAARVAGEGQMTKMEMMYGYLTGPGFRHRIEAIVEQFTEMQSDLERERRAITKMWSKREQQIRSVLESTAGMYGDLQGIAGQSIKEIEGLSVELLAGPDED